MGIEGWGGYCYFQLHFCCFNVHERLVFVIILCVKISMYYLAENKSLSTPSIKAQLLRSKNMGKASRQCFRFGPFPFHFLSGRRRIFFFLIFASLIEITLFPWPISLLRLLSPTCHSFLHIHFCRPSRGKEHAPDHCLQSRLIQTWIRTHQTYMIHFWATSDKCKSKRTKAKSRIFPPPHHIYLDFLHFGQPTRRSLGLKQLSPYRSYHN